MAIIAAIIWTANFVFGERDLISSKYPHITIMVAPANMPKTFSFRGTNRSMLIRQAK
jgi:hypothetical protein